MRQTTSRSRLLLSLLALGLFASACTSNEVDQSFAEFPTTEHVGLRRAWRPGERDSLVAAMQTNGALAGIPYIGDLSEYADLMFEPDSTTDVVPNPYFVPELLLTGPSPRFSLNAMQVPGNGWTETGLDVRLVNNNPGEVDLDWLGTLWSLDSDPDRKGLILAASAGTTFPTTTVNTTNFDNSGATSGVSAAEINPNTTPFTYWENRGEGGTFRVISTTFSGGTTTLTSGPYQGGTMRTGTQSQVLSAIRMTRRAGSGNPNQLTASMTATITAWELTCIFPTPCTTDNPALAAAALKGPLPDSLYRRLPWIKAMPASEREEHMRARMARRLRG